MKTCIVGMIAALLIAAAARAATPAVDGTWTAKVPTPNGQRSLDAVFTFKVDGGKLTGTAAAAGAGDAYKLVDTTIDGDQIAFAVDGEPAHYTGTIAGDEIKMKVTYKSSENGTRTWSFVAKRASAP